jgi:acyl-CoA synthetase (NDP forming)
MSGISAASLLSARSVAIVGDSLSGRGRGAVLRERLRTTGYQGRIVPVNPRYAEIAGLTAYPSVAAIPGGVDLVACALPAESTISIMRDAVTAGATSFIALAGGFAETGAHGREMQQELARLASEHGICLLGPNSLGLVDLHGGRQFFFGDLPKSLRTGRVALLFQSGALVEAVTESFVRRGIGVSHVVTTGNEAATGVADYLEVLCADEHADVIVCLLETVRDVARFRDAALAARRAGKAVVVLRNGVSEVGRRAAASHTGALVGDARAHAALFASVGAVRVRDIEELVEATALLITAPGQRALERPAGPLIVTSHSGGACELLADLATEAGLAMATLSDAARTALREVLPSFAAVGNPLDLTAAGGLDAGLRDAVLAILGREPGVGAIVYGMTSADVSEAVDPAVYPRPVIDSLIAAAASTDAPLVPLALTALQVEPSQSARALDAGSPLLCGARASISALAAVFAAVPAATPAPGTHASATLPARLLEQVSALGPVLSERESKQVLQAAGVPCVPEVLAQTETEALAAAARFGWPVAAKLEARGLLHKSDAGAVRLGIGTRQELAQAYAELLRGPAAVAAGQDVTGVLIQPMISDGLDMIVGVSWDAEVGALIACGMGGVLAEAIDDVAVRCAPVTADEALDMIAGLRYAHVIQDGFRHLPPGDTEQLAHAVAALSRLGYALGPAVEAIDVNPLRLRERGRGVLALDASIVTARSKTESAVRRAGGS